MILSVDGILLISTMLHFIEIRDYLQSLKISSQKITVFQRKSILEKLKISFELGKWNKSELTMRR